MRRCGWLLWAPLVLWMASACGSPEDPCAPVGAARPICGFEHPEDLDLLPDGHTVVVSEYGRIGGGEPGRIALLDLRTERRTIAFAGGGGAEPELRWGDPECPGPPGPEFSPHGIHVARRDDGALALLAVQHGDRESVELFELAQRGGAWQIAWRGCAVAPPDAWLNDVVGLPDGGFLVTHMLSRAKGREGLTESLVDQKKGGFVYAWSPGRGYERLEGSEAAAPNGIEISPDAATVYLNVAGAGEIWKMSLAGEVLQRVAVPAADNSTWAPDGRLLVASVPATTPGAFRACENLGRTEPCPLRFEIVAIDWTDGSTEVLYAGGPPLIGAGTVGLQVGDDLLIGSFAGDRILRVDLSRQP